MCPCLHGVGMGGGRTCGVGERGGGGSGGWKTNTQVHGHGDAYTSGGAHFYRNRWCCCLAIVCLPPAPYPPPPPTSPQVVSDPKMSKSGVYWSWSDTQGSFENQVHNWVRAGETTASRSPRLHRACPLSHAPHFTVSRLPLTHTRTLPTTPKHRCLRRFLTMPRRRNCGNLARSLWAWHSRS